MVMTLFLPLRAYSSHDIYMFAMPRAPFIVYSKNCFFVAFSYIKFHVYLLHSFCLNKTWIQINEIDLLFSFLSIRRRKSSRISCSSYRRQNKIFPENIVMLKLNSFTNNFAPYIATQSMKKKLKRREKYRTEKTKAKQSRLSTLPCDYIVSHCVSAFSFLYYAEKQINNFIRLLL